MLALKKKKTHHYWQRTILRHWRSSLLMLFVSLHEIFQFKICPPARLQERLDFDFVRLIDHCILMCAHG